MGNFDRFHRPESAELLKADAASPARKPMVEATANKHKKYAHSKVRRWRPEQVLARIDTAHLKAPFVTLKVN